MSSLGFYSLLYWKTFENLIEKIYNESMTCFVLRGKFLFNIYIRAYHFGLVIRTDTLVFYLLLESTIINYRITPPTDAKA